MSAHHTILAATLSAHREGRLPLLDCLSQIETLALDPACSDAVRFEGLLYAAQQVDGIDTALALSTDELRAVLDDFDTYFPAN